MIQVLIQNNLLPASFTSSFFREVFEQREDHCCHLSNFNEFFKVMLIHLIYFRVHIHTTKFCFAAQQWFVCLYCLNLTNEYFVFQNHHIFSKSRLFKCKYYQFFAQAFLLYHQQIFLENQNYEFYQAKIKPKFIK